MCLKYVPGTRLGARDAKTNKTLSYSYPQRQGSGGNLLVQLPCYVVKQTDGLDYFQRRTSFLSPYIFHYSWSLAKSFLGGKKRGGVMSLPIEVRDSLNAEKDLLPQRKTVHFLIFSKYSVISLSNICILFQLAWIKNKQTQSYDRFF